MDIDSVVTINVSDKMMEQANKYIGVGEITCKDIIGFGWNNGFERIAFFFGTKKDAAVFRELMKVE